MSQETESEVLMDIPLQLNIVHDNSGQIISDDDNNTLPAKNLCTQKWSRKNPNKIYLLLYNLIMPFVVITVAALFAFLFQLPFIFPSLGPTAFLQFSIPAKAPASPKNTLIGHFIGIVAGSLSLQICDLYEDGSVLDGVNVQRIFCASTSVGLTCFLMILFQVAHPPAGATTLIVSLGILKTPEQLACIMAGVLLLTIQAFGINRLFRLDTIYPFWSANDESNSDLKQPEQNFLRGYSKMRLSRMNIKIKKLNSMMDNLKMDNLLEYFALCTQLESDEHIKLLIKFAQDNKEKLLSLTNYKKIIPYSTRVIMGCDV